MKNLKDVLIGKGVYLIAIVCVALVCTVGLYISNLDNNQGDDPNDKVIANTDDGMDVIAPQSTVKPTATPAISGPNSSNPSTATKSPTATAPGGLKMSMPVTGDVLVDYAMDKLVYSKTLEEWRTHSGIDIAGNFGDPVKAAADGKVIDAKKDPRLGYLVILEHSNGLKSVYANLKDEIAVKVNQSVKQGDILGWIGRTSTFETKENTHVHFEVLYNDNCVNVWNYIPKK
jgi:murein DD-endopeptidase MepM/ murein hydrolase activator NlpD